MFDPFNHTGTPPTGDDLRALIADTGIAEDSPVTAQLLEELAQASDEKTGDRARDDARLLFAIVRAIVSLEHRVNDVAAPPS